MRIRSLIAASAVALLLAGCVTEGKPKLTHAEPALRQAAEINIQLGFEHMRNGRRADAVLKFERAVEQDPDNPNGFIGLAIINEQVGDHREARRRYQQAAKVGADDPAVRNAWGAYLCRRGEHAKAEAEFVAASKMLRNRAPEEALANAGLCLRRAKQDAKAEEYLRSALALRPEYGPALLELADLSFSRGDALRSRAFLQRMAESNRLDARALLLFHRTELALGDKRSADRYADQLRRDYPDSAEARGLGAR